MYAPLVGMALWLLLYKTTNTDSTDCRFFPNFAWYQTIPRSLGLGDVLRDNSWHFLPVFAVPWQTPQLPSPRPGIPRDCLVLLSSALWSGERQTGHSISSATNENHTWVPIVLQPPQPLWETEPKKKKTLRATGGIEKQDQVWKEVCSLPDRLSVLSFSSVYSK